MKPLRIAGTCRKFAFAGVVLVGIVATGTASTQAADAGGILANGNAAVTGFSGAELPVMVQPGVNPADQIVIDLNEPSTRIIDIQAPGAPPQAQILAAPKPFTVTAGQIGQVFGIALDSATPPNIYVGATSAYGLPIIVPGPAGSTVRVKQGAPNAVFMPGLFGPQGGPGSIWRIDGATGAVSLFANVTLNGTANSGPALGGLAFDAASNTLFVADRDTGMILSLDVTGAERSRYDHGVQGRPTAGLPAVPFDPTKRLNITSPQFHTDNPATWRYAPPERRVFGLAVHAGRLYYAVAQGLQIWSVAIAADGTFGTDARIEISLPPGQTGSEISKITFDDQGRMYLAERAAPTGVSDFGALAQPGASRVLRYAPAQTGAVAWQAIPDAYAIGFPAQMRNGNGGVAIGYGYDASGRLDPNACSGFLWSTGEQLRASADPAVAARLVQGGPATVNGLQGNSIDLVRPANIPPWQTYFVDDDDRFDPAARGHVGDIAIWRLCAQANLPGVPPAAFPGLASPFVVPPGPLPLPPPFPPFTPGTGIPAGQVTPACPNPQPGFMCCPTPMKPGADGKCQSPCANGDTNPKSMDLCFRGFAPPADPNTFNPATAKCWDGSNPVPVLPGGPPGARCPAPLNASCPVGQTLGPAPQQLSQSIWTNATCQGAPQQQLCPGQWEWPHTQCCPVGTVADPNGKCVPQQQTGGAPTLQEILPNVLTVEQQPTPGACNAGLLCCPAFTVQDSVSGQCKSLCADGSMDLESRKACYSGYQPPVAGQKFNPATGKCQLSGATPTSYFTCPAPPSAGCSWGYTKEQKPVDIPGTWTDFDCKPTPAQDNCLKQGKRLGLDGVHCIDVNSCPAETADPMVPAQTLWKGCCPDGTPLDANGVCVAGATKQTQTLPGQPIQPAPQNLPPGAQTDPCVGSGYTYLPSGICCRPDQVTRGGQCCPAGQQPDVSGNACVPVTFPPTVLTPFIPRPRPLPSCPPGQPTLRGECCPPGYSPDVHRRFCEPVGQPRVVPYPPYPHPVTPRPPVVMPRSVPSPAPVVSPRPIPRPIPVTPGVTERHPRPIPTQPSPWRVHPGLPRPVPSRPLNTTAPIRSCPPGTACPR